MPSSITKVSKSLLSVSVPLMLSENVDCGDSCGSDVVGTYRIASETTTTYFDTWRSTVSIVNRITRAYLYCLCKYILRTNDRQMRHRGVKMRRVSSCRWCFAFHSCLLVLLLLEKWKIGRAEQEEDYVVKGERIWNFFFFFTFQQNQNR